MAKTRTSFKKGEGGRTKGAVNKTTKEAKELLNSILFGELENIRESLQSVRAKNPGQYIDLCAKLFTYVLPKKTDITSDDEPIKQKLEIIVDDKKTGDTLKKLRGE